jgi:hypothetical protein
VLIGTTTFHGLTKPGEVNVVDVDGGEEDQEERLLDVPLVTAGEVGSDEDGLRVYKVKSKDAGRLKRWLVEGSDVALEVM